MNAIEAGCVALALLVSTTAGAAGVGVVMDSDNRSIGQYVEQSRAITGGTIVHSPTGFRLAINGRTAQLIPVDVDASGTSYDNELVYGNLNCAGQGFVGLSNDQPAGGIVFPGPDGYYYVPKAATAAVILVGSVRSGTTCTAVTPFALLAVPASPNDPVVTGVPNLIFLPPIRIEMVPLSQFLGGFRDGFESADASRAYATLPARAGQAHA